MFRGLIGQTVIVNLKGEPAAFRGTLTRRGIFAIRLSDVSVLEPDGRTPTLEGHVRIPRRSVSWIQEL